MSFDALVQDVRYGWRTMRRAPGVAAVCIGSSAIGIGGCSIIVAIVTFTLFQQLPVEAPGRLLGVSEVNLRTDDAGNELSYPDLRDLRQARAFEGIAGADSLIPASIGVQGEPQRHWGAIVTANYFAVVRPRFVLGRGFDADRDDRAGEAPVVVVSHRFWQTRFQGDPNVVGRTVTFNGRTATVIGVTEAGFRGVQLAIVSDFWIPFSMTSTLEARRGPMSENRHRHWLEAVGRLRPGVDPREARAELQVIAQRMNAADPEGDKDRTFRLDPAGRMMPALRGVTATVFMLLSGAALALLLTACVNVANLLLGRASARTREIAARMALGASRGRIVRQLLTESLLLALAGGAGGWIIASYGASLLGRLRLPLAWPIDLTIAPDYRVLLVSLGLSILTGLLFGLVPALRATRLDLVSDLKSDAHGTTRAAGSRGRPGGPFGLPGLFGLSGLSGLFGLRNGLVVVQVAICTVLLLCTGLFLRSLRATQDIDLGIDSIHRNLLLLAFDPSLERGTDTRARLLLRDVLDRARAVPGVESATLTTAAPLTLIVDNSNFVREEQLADPAPTRVRSDIISVAPRFFETLGIPFLAGRDFGNETDTGTNTNTNNDANGGRERERVAIVNEAFARAAFPGFPQESPIGRRIGGDGKRLRIVGVVGTVKSRTIGEAPRPSLYLPMLTDYTAAQSITGVTLIVQTREAAEAYAGPLRDAIRRADPTLAVYDIRTLEHHLERARIVPRLAGLLSTVTGGGALAIAMIGVYGVISFAVARRRREIGIRLAIGARPGEILAMMLWQGLAMTMAGTVAGILIGLGVTRLLASVLYVIDPRDTLTFVVVPAVLTAIALLACLLPARAAARTDPLTVLRSE